MKQREREREISSKVERKRGRKYSVQPHVLISGSGVSTDQESVLHHSPMKDSS
ncbi:hypothetical protein TorRG33x02_119240 [Trema orientale]|uniref:Uncharacterized protein n=1 Tax=Trema orientale TaxID=63057 RepID=A0A2P5F3C1_TREOI|nr:hypothetical protein TorRG33x02_119240 [Trema orientale]